MKKKSTYHKLEVYNDCIEQLKIKGMTFEVHKTHYSKRIKIDNGRSLHFNKDGEGDDRILGLINRVRKDAAEYMSQTDEIKLKHINWFDMIQIPEEEDIITKIDIRGAYWNAAIKMGVISENTNLMLLEMYKDEPSKVMKSSRLKALGSLATTKEVSYFQNGKQVMHPEGSELAGLPFLEITTELTKPLYMKICENIDQLMKEIAKAFPLVVYYYWDCIFAHKSSSEEIIKFIKKKGYDVTTSSTKLSYVHIGRHSQLISISDDKMYMVPKEKKHLLENFQYQRN